MSHFFFGMGWTHKRQALISKITTDVEIIGWGESGGHHSTQIIHKYFLDFLIGADP